MKVVISGSFRKHLQKISQALKNFKKLGVKVLAPQTTEVINSNDGFVFLATDDLKKSADVLEKEFMANIKRANFLYVANAGGYVGQNTATEMGVAIINNIPIVCAEEIKVFSDQISNKAQELIKKSVFWQLPINEINSEKIVKLKLANFTPVNLSNKEILLLKSLVKKLLENLKPVKIASMSNLRLKQNPTMQDFQNYVAKMVKERGFDSESISEIFMLFLEECGEMAKAARKIQNIKTDKKSKKLHLDHEIADVFIYLLDICNHYNIDLEKAFRDKEAANKKRFWE